MNRIKFYLKKRKMSQRKLAEEIGTTESAICRYIKEQRIPNVHMALKMAIVLGADVYDLFGGDTIE